MEDKDFLNPDTEQIRHQILGILDSYSHDWDILAELLQNSVDAIRIIGEGKELGASKGHISLSIDVNSKTIRVTDNGCGIEPADFTKLLRPFGTNKSGKPRQIGEKGVGLKFVMFSSSSFKITTNGYTGPCTATVQDASHWVKSDVDETLYLKILDKSSLTNGTEVTVKLASDDHPIFSYSFEELIFIIRTRTACGDCGYIWKDPFDADLQFEYVGKDGVKRFTEFECKYLLPTEKSSPSDVISIDAFQQWLIDGDRSDQDKRKKLMNKIVVTQGKKQHSGREIRYWSCFVPRREYWKTLSVNVGIHQSEEDLEDFYRIGFSGGLNTSTKGMPTGISIELKPLGSAGYVPNFFILVDDPSLRFDIGRKYVQGRQQGMLREVAYENFRDYLNKTQKYMGGTIDPNNPLWNRDEVFEEIEGLPDLNSSKTSFVKRPNSQEATVAAIFFELIGKGLISGIRPLISGYKGRYDLYAKWDKRRIVLEFKYDLLGLFRDFNDEKKMFDEINAVVIWEVTEADRVQAARRGIGIEEVQTSQFTVASNFPDATKVLTLGNVNPIWVVELKTIVSN